jgi:phosphoribosyl 1,2-cyclic phosphodiesterase
MPDRMARAEVTLRFWGTRGSIPSPGPATARYGGNTACIEVRYGRDRRIIFDAGSGIRPLGHDLVASGESADGTVFLTHFHWDHIQGFPFFAPLYRPETSLEIVGPMQQNLDIRSLFAGQMGPVYFPVPFTALSANLAFRHLNEGTWEGDGYQVTAMRVRHPSFTVGYRVQVGGHVIVYVPDNELGGASYDVGEGWYERFQDFVRGADVLIHDAMYTNEEYPARLGWGHSTFDRAVELAESSNVSRLFLFHHSPERTDEELSAIVDRLRETQASRGSKLAIDAADEGEAVVMEVKP